LFLAVLESLGATFQRRQNLACIKAARLTGTLSECFALDNDRSQSAAFLSNSYSFKPNLEAD
jgi:hypothetical protein